MFPKTFNARNLLSSHSPIGISAASTSYARVVDIILDDSHEYYNTYGKSQSINGVFYRFLDQLRDEEDLESLQFAYQGSSNIRRVPLKGEIVKIEFRTSETRDVISTSEKAYWIDIVPIWNHPHHNDYPDVILYPELEEQPDFGEYFEESKKVNPLQLFPGDMCLESRYGQSIRFSGTKYNSNPWIDDSNNGSPILIIRNGQKEEQEQDVGEDSISSIIEDINEDSSSIYLTSDHTVELQSANLKRDAWNTKPEDSNKYKGSQILLNSDRVFINSKKDSILLSSKVAVGANADTINLDADSYIALDSKKIYLGVAARKREHEPVILGETGKKWLEDYLSQFEQLINTMSKLPPAPAAAIPVLITIANTLLPIIKILKQQLPLIQSKKVFIE